MIKSSETGQLLHQLKRVIKARGLRYLDIAASIGVSEKTVKRYMMGRGLAVETLETLCRTVGVTLLELAEMTAHETHQDRFVDHSTEEVLGEDLFTGMIFTLLIRGWLASDLPTALGISPAELNASLVKLDRLGVIRLDPFNRVRVIAKTRRDFRTPRPAGTKRIKALMFDRLAKIDRDDPDLVWRIGMARLSPDQLKAAARLYDELLASIYAIETRTTDDAQAAKARWYILPMLIAPNQRDLPLSAF